MKSECRRKCRFFMTLCLVECLLALFPALLWSSPSTPPSAGVTGEMRQPAPRPVLDAGEAGPVGTEVSHEEQDRLKALYERADTFFLQHQTELDQYASEVQKHYSEALQHGVAPGHTPRALYRCGLSYLAMKKPDKAATYFKRILSEYPEDPVVNACQLRYAEIFQDARSYAEAVDASRRVLQTSSSEADKTEAHYSIGKSLTLAGRHQLAVESYQQCLKIDPLFYLKQPDLLKFMGESLSFLKEYERSCESLLHYLNLRPDTPERDLLLAKIAETLLSQEDERLANRLHRYLQANFPDSEGDFISTLRKAEHIENRSPEEQDRAALLYHELSRKQLPSPLHVLVKFKLAHWEAKHGNHRESLAIIDEMLQTNPQGPTYEQFASLRARVMEELLKRSFNEKKHDEVVRLYQENIPMFKKLRPPEIFGMVGESYEELQIYPQAVASYEAALDASGEGGGRYLLNIARCSFRMGDLEKAAQCCRKVRVHDLESQKNELLARIYFAQGNYPEALRQLGLVLPGGREPAFSDFEWVNMYAESYLNTGRHPDALQWVQKGLALLKEESPEKRLQLLLVKGRCHQKLSQSVEAIKCLEEALGLVQGEDLKEQLTYEISNLYLQTGEKEKAVQKLSQILGSPNPFWQAAAQQQIDYLQLKEKGLQLF
jgi:tetratricopeptide (TPR) repeat protein